MYSGVKVFERRYQTSDPKADSFHSHQVVPKLGFSANDVQI